MNSEGISKRLETLDSLLFEGIDGVDSNELVYLTSQFESFRALVRGEQVDFNIAALGMDVSLQRYLSINYPRYQNHFNVDELAEIAALVRRDGLSPFEYLANKLSSSSSRALMVGLDVNIENDRDPLQSLGNDLVKLAKAGLLTHVAIAAPQSLYAAYNSGNFEEIYGLQLAGSKIDAQTRQVEIERTVNLLRTLNPFVTIVPYMAEEDPKCGEELRRDEEARYLKSFFRRDKIGMVILGNEAEINKINVSHDPEAEFVTESLS